jgi:hypothetical protein
MSEEILPAVKIALEKVSKNKSNVVLLVGLLLIAGGLAYYFTRDDKNVD